VVGGGNKVGKRKNSTMYSKASAFKTNLKGGKRPMALYLFWDQEHRYPLAKPQGGRGSKLSDEDKAKKTRRVPLFRKKKSNNS